MPIISLFYGIIIRMYNDDHNPPHFHVQYGEHEAVISIKTGKVLYGRIPRRTLRLVEEWRKLRIKEINLAWKAAQNLESPKKISPLD